MDIEKKVAYLLDRLAIEDQVKRYSHLIDRKMFDQLNEVFTDDAWIDYTASGGAAGDLEATKGFLKQSMGRFASQHLMSNVECEFGEDGKSAKGSVMLFNPMTMTTPDGPYTFFCGVWYHDEWIKTAEGVWKMTKRVQENSYAYHRPLVKKEA
ncbi:MAG: nuclear transport factor 2 family protein [Oscillospiraceae bacterium]